MEIYEKNTVPAKNQVDEEKIVSFKKIAVFDDGFLIFIRTAQKVELLTAMFAREREKSFSQNVIWREVVYFLKDYDLAVFCFSDWIFAESIWSHAVGFVKGASHTITVEIRTEQNRSYLVHIYNHSFFEGMLLVCRKTENLKMLWKNLFYFFVMIVLARCYKDSVNCLWAQRMIMYHMNKYKKQPRIAGLFFV